MNDNFFDIKNESHLISPINVENNSFLLFSDNRKNYFK